jgi:hypothetical protein
VSTAPLAESQRRLKNKLLGDAGIRFAKLSRVLDKTYPVWPLYIGTESVYLHFSARRSSWRVFLRLSSQDSARL